MAPDYPLGIYGKIPILGDFVSRRLPRDFIHPWDEWLQDSITASKRRLREQWLDIYLTSPIWRFIMSSGVCGRAAWAGVLIPSVDKVGRYFPLTMAARIPEGDAVPGLFIRAEAWFDKAEETSLSALHDDFSMAEFDKKYNHSPLPQSEFLPEAQSHEAGRNRDGAFFSAEMVSPADLPAAMVRLSDNLMLKTMPACSIWLSPGSDHVKPALRVYEGLPKADAYSAFLTDQAN